MWHPIIEAGKESKEEGGRAFLYCRAAAAAVWFITEVHCTALRQLEHSRMASELCMQTARAPHPLMISGAQSAISPLHARSLRPNCAAQPYGHELHACVPPGRPLTCVGHDLDDSTQGPYVPSRRLGADMSVAAYFRHGCC